MADLGTCESKDGTVRSASGGKVGHVASASVDKNGTCSQVVCHRGCAGTDLLGLPPLVLVGEWL